MRATIAEVLKEIDGTGYTVAYDGGLKQGFTHSLVSTTNMKGAHHFSPDIRLDEDNEVLLVTNALKAMGYIILGEDKK